jgi:O-antigen/teichoic acid export membrane protein
MFILRAEEKSGLFVANNLIRMFLRVGLGVTYVVILRRAALGALEASFITSLLFTIYLLIHRIKKTGFGFNLQILMNILKYGSPLVIFGFGWFIMSASDKYFLKEYSSLEQVGIYSVGYTLGYGVMIIVGAFGNAWPQMMFSYDETDDAGIFYGKVLTYYTAILGLVWIGVTLFSKEIVMLMTAEKFWGAYQVIPLIMLAYIFHGALTITSAGIYTKNKTYNEIILTPITVCICLMLNFFFIRKWGMMGAAWATLLSFSFQFLLYTLRAKKYVYICFQWSKLMKIILLIGVVAFLSSIMPDYSLKINILIKLLSFSTVLFIFYTPYYFHNELKVFLNAIIKKASE